MIEERYMNISEVEKLTGITKQSIRFYEKEGLLHPVRNNDNGGMVSVLEETEIIF